MRAVVAERLESVGDYALVETAPPRPGRGEVLIDVAYCGVGHADALVALGRYQVKPSLPYVPGSEVSGRIAALGDGVVGLAVGDRVMAVVRGGFADRAVASSASVLVVPSGLKLVQAAALRTDYLTALHALADRAALRAGERLLVRGAGGGVGLAAVAVGKALGGTVIAAASTADKRDMARQHGADETIDSVADGWRDRIKASGAPDVVFDPVCGPLFEATFRSLGWGGRYLVIGFTGGAIPALPANLPLLKGAGLIGADIRQFALRDPDRVSLHLTQLLDWAVEGRITPTVGRIFDLPDFAGALTFALSGQGVGKTILRVGGEGA